MATNDLMHQVSETAQQTHATSIDVQGQVKLTADTLHTLTEDTIPKLWLMDQAFAFQRAEAKFYTGLQMLHNEMGNIGNNTIQAMFQYNETDVTHAANLNRIEPAIQVQSLTQLT